MESLSYHVMEKLQYSHQGPSLSLYGFTIYFKCHWQIRETSVRRSTSALPLPFRPDTLLDVPQESSNLTPSCEYETGNLKPSFKDVHILVIKTQEYQTLSAWNSSHGGPAPKVKKVWGFNAEFYVYTTGAQCTDPPKLNYLA